MVDSLIGKRTSRPFPYDQKEEDGRFLYGDFEGLRGSSRSQTSNSSIQVSASCSSAILPSSKYNTRAFLYFASALRPSSQPALLFVIIL